MYTVSPARVRKSNSKGQPIGIRNAWQVADGDFVAGVVPRQEDAQWIADIVNKAIARDRQVRSWGMRFRHWVQGWLPERTKGKVKDGQ